MYDDIVQRQHGAWKSMHSRCTNPNTKSYPAYGGRGITVCPEWRDFNVFFVDMGRRPEGATLERIDNDRGYCKDNCRWASRAEQARNYRKNVDLTFNGKTMCLTDWAAHIGISPKTLFSRHYDGWSVERMLTTPAKIHNPIPVSGMLNTDK